MRPTLRALHDVGQRALHHPWCKSGVAGAKGPGVGVLLILLLSPALTCSQAFTDELAKMMAGKKEIFVELAVTAQERMLGMQFRTSLAEDQGMLFVFPTEGRHVFWMKDTYIPLSVAFITKDGVITQIDEMEPLSLEHHVSRERVKYALEMKAGWFKRNNIRVGDMVIIPQQVEAATVNK